VTGVCSSRSARARAQRAPGSARAQRAPSLGVVASRDAHDAVRTLDHFGFEGPLERASLPPPALTARATPGTPKKPFLTRSGAQS